MAVIRAHHWPPAITQSAIQKQVRIGMTPAQVRAAWGNPEDINRTIVPGRVIEQWVYDSGAYVYLENGVVTGIQN